MIGAIVSNYGRFELAERCIKSFLKTTEDIDVRLVVVTTGIPDYEENTELDIPEDKIFCHAKFSQSMGKGYSQNVGRTILQEKCKYLNIEEPDYYVYFDNDVIFREDWLQTGLDAYREYSFKYPVLSFYQGGSGPHRTCSQLVDNYKNGHPLLVVNSCQGICWLMNKDVAEVIGKVTTVKPISGIDWYVIRKLAKQMLVLEGYVEHIGFGHSTHRGELQSWDTQKSHDDMLREKYGTVKD